MKRFILKLLAFAFIPVAMYIYFLFVIPVPEEVYFNAYNKKCELLEKTPSPRIILISGSSGAFGFDSKRISDSLNLPVINTSMHAGVGLKFMIDDVATYLRKGDILVISPEFAQFDIAPYGEALTLPIQLKAMKYRSIHLLNEKQWRVFIKGIPELRKYKKASDNGRYTASGFNEYGDEVAHLTMPGIEIPNEIKKKRPLDEEFCNYFANKMKEIEQMGCVVIVTPPAHCENLYNAEIDNIEGICKKLEELGYPFNTDPHNHTIPDSCAFDTWYHLNRQGVEIYTGKIIEELKKTLNR